jgi:PIN domain nuclease of toxin-antitoxin system
MSERLPQRARALIDERDPCASPLAILELAYLKEVGRARDPVPAMLAALRRDIGLEVVDVSLAELAQAATDLTWTRDPFDRLLSAHAIVAGVPLLTADRTIRENLPLATWD